MLRSSYRGSGGRGRTHDDRNGEVGQGRRYDRRDLPGHGDQVNVGADTKIQGLTEVPLSDVEVDSMAVVVGESAESGEFDASSVIVLPEGRHSLEPGASGGPAPGSAALAAGDSNEPIVRHGAWGRGGLAWRRRTCLGCKRQLSGKDRAREPAMWRRLHVSAPFSG